MATIRKVKRKQGHAYVAIISKKGVKSFSKTFKKLSNAKTWAREVEADAEYLAARRDVVQHFVTTQLSSHSGDNISYSVCNI